MKNGKHRVWVSRDFGGVVSIECAGEYDGMISWLVFKIWWLRYVIRNLVNNGIIYYLAILIILYDKYDETLWT